VLAQGARRHANKLGAFVDTNETVTHGALHGRSGSVSNGNLQLWNQAANGRLKRGSEVD